MKKHRRPAIGTFLFLGLCLFMGAYFTFSAVQGESGLFRRIHAEADVAELRAELAAYQTQVAMLENKTRRMSDEFLDLDLLDEQARSILGLTRADEIIIP